MGQKLTGYVPPLTQDLTNKVVLYSRLQFVSKFPSATGFLEAMRLSHLIGKRKLKYKKIKEV